MICSYQDELDAYLSEIADRMAIYRAKEGSILEAQNKNDVLPPKPNFVSLDTEVKILNMMSEMDPCPKTFKKYQQIFQSGLTYDELVRELDNDDNWID